jgi:dTDP-4-amino-4,6-dideoxygalactose transaminase
MKKLALFGGTPCVSISLPHEIWPPLALNDEIEELSYQRNNDISIRGRTGPIAEFEDLFKEFLENQVDYVISFNSGTSALLAAYFSLGIEEGDEVIGPALTYHAALSPLFILRANPVLVDIDINSRCIDPEQIEKKITERTKAITVVHQWGHPANMNEIMEIAKKHNLFVIEDCSHAHGSRYNDRLCGTFGDVAVFSLQTNKAIFAGEGGVFVTNNPEFHDRATLLGHYRDRSKKEIVNPELQQYWVTGFGLKLRMSPFNAIVAKHSLNHFPTIKSGRHRCLKYFTERLNEIRYIDGPYQAPNIDMGAWYGFKPLYKKEFLNQIPRTELVKMLQAEGLEINAPSGPTLASLPLYNSSHNPLFTKKNPWKPNFIKDFPNACQVEQEGLSLPTFYSWENDHILIDQYLDAFHKIEDCL